MLIVSQNITNYQIPVPDNAVFRINLAWVNNLDELSKILEIHNKTKIFLDLPINRTKPPNNKYTLDEIIEIIKSHDNIEYFAISNVESKNNLVECIEKLPKSITLVPKIESPIGIENIEEIAKCLDYKPRVMMLDHDDLYSNLLKSKISHEKFTVYINQLTEYCKSNDIVLLRTIGVIFSDEEKRISDYVN
jgi:citrate lyase beta subunit